jgi:hypothetical protein
MKWDKQAIAMEKIPLPTFRGRQVCCEVSYVNSYEVFNYPLKYLLR